MRLNGASPSDPRRNSMRAVPDGSAIHVWSWAGYAARRRSSGLTGVVIGLLSPAGAIPFEKGNLVPWHKQHPQPTMDILRTEFSGRGLTSNVVTAGSVFAALKYLQPWLVRQFGITSANADMVITLLSIALGVIAGRRLSMAMNF